MRKVGIGLLGGIGLVLITMALPSAVFAQVEEYNGPIGDCLTTSDGDREVFMSCLQENRDEIAESHKLPAGWFERIEVFTENNADWSRRIRAIVDRLEDRRDRRENKADRREDRRDHIEDIWDRAEDKWDRWEDRHDEERDREDLFDRWEDRRDRAEDMRDRMEDRHDRIEDWKDRLEDRRDRRWP